MAYEITPQFLEAAMKSQKRLQVNAGIHLSGMPLVMPPIPCLFADFTGMKWTFSNLPGPIEKFDGKLILDGVTLYLPDQKVILVIETKEKHEAISELISRDPFDWKSDSSKPQ